MRPLGLACTKVWEPPRGLASTRSQLRPDRALASSRPMHETTPQVFLIARPSIDVEGMRGYLADVGGESWLRAPPRRVRRRAQRRRAGRRVRRPRLLPQLGAGAEPERDEGAHRPARVLRQHPALGARQRARARELLVRAAQREPCLYSRARQASRRLGLQPGEPALRAPHRHRLSRAAGARAGARAGAGDRRAARGVPGQRGRASWGSTRRAFPSTSRRRSPRRCAAWRRSA